MIYTVGMKKTPNRSVSPDVGDVLSVVLPDGGSRYFRAITGTWQGITFRCSKHCPMAQNNVLLPGKHTKWNICGYAEFNCHAEARDYHWEEVPIETLIEEMI